MKLTSTQFINVSLLAFLFLALFFDNADVYRFFFFAGVMPGVLWFFWKSTLPDLFKTMPTIIIALFISYLSFNSLLVSNASWADKVDQLRWGIEVLFLSSAIVLSSQCWLNSSRIYGRLFLFAVLLGALFALVVYIFQADFKIRLSGNGFLSHPIQGPSTLLVLWTLGFGLFFVPSRSPVRTSDYFLLFLSGLMVFFVAIFSQSRGPVAATLLTFSFSLFALYLVVPTVRRQIIFGSSVALIFGVYFLLYRDWLIRVFTARDLSYRPEIWSAVINNVETYWLFGVGSATKFSDTVPGVVAKESTGFVFDHTHNIFFQVWLSGGLIASLMLLGVMVSLIRKLFAKNFTNQYRLFFAGSTALVVLVMVNFTDTAIPISAPRPDWVLFWLPLLFVTSLVTWRPEKRVVA